MKLEFESNVATTPSFAGNYSADVESADEKDVSAMLQAGVKAAQNGSRAEARNLLLQVTEAAPENENAWLWLASISDYPEELLVFLNNVLNINPNNARALEWSAATKSLLAKNFVQRGVDASNEARMDLARQYFLQAVFHDERNEMAWFWLASISDSAEEKLSHLQKVLNINPENETALTAFQIAKAQITESLLRKANTAAIAGEREAASEMLQKILKQTPDLEEAWILKSYLADSFSDKVICFEKVLSINPENDAAISGLASLREMMARTENRKSQNLAAVAAFLAETSAEDKTEAVADSTPTAALPEESADNSVEFAEMIEVSEVDSENDATESSAMPESSVSTAPVETENNSYSYQEEISEDREPFQTAAEPNGAEFAETVEANDFQAVETTLEADDYQSAETTIEADDYTETENFAEVNDYQTAESVAESETDGVVENAPQNYADNFAPEIYAPQEANFESNIESPLEADYPANVEAAAPFQETTPAVKRIMVIDDSATVRKLIARKLEMSGYEVICSADGIEALEMIKNVVPDLILLDTAMPQMDGYQICQAIRGNEATRDVPVVMISGKDGFFDKVRGQMAGSTGYIAKPFGPETLMKTIETYLD